MDGQPPSPQRHVLKGIGCMCSWLASQPGTSTPPCLPPPVCSTCSPPPVCAACLEHVLQQACCVLGQPHVLLAAGHCLEHPVNLILLEAGPDLQGEAGSNAKNSSNQWPSLPFPAVFQVRLKVRPPCIYSTRLGEPSTVPGRGIYIQVLSFACSSPAGGMLFRVSGLLLLLLLL